MSLLNTTLFGARAALRHTARVASGVSGRAMVAGSNVTTMNASRVGPVSAPQSAMYHDIIIDHYESPRNVGKCPLFEENLIHAPIGNMFHGGKGSNEGCRVFPTRQQCQCTCWKGNIRACRRENGRVREEARVPAASTNQLFSS
eukprot:gb/GECG01006088.1/.p1 GENE.gb/GECG01006088.1/~~gb/GECG01006088.1/.p1  ORF type:complete len:144 (+),score=5.47 gb/GECG01006088.1/:1-432(+)